MIQKMPQSVEFPQVQNNDKFIGVPVLMLRQVPTIHCAEKGGSAASF